MAKIIQHPASPTFPWQAFVPANTNAGIPYHVPWEPPYFPKRVPPHLIQSDFFMQWPYAPIVAVSGMAWFARWDEPKYKATPYPIHTSQECIVRYVFDGRNRGYIIGLS